MYTKKKSLRRLTVLYVVFFVVIAASLVLSINANSFNEQYKTARNDARRVTDLNFIGENKEIDIFHDMPVATGNMNFRMPVFMSPSGSMIHARPATLDIEALSSDGELDFKGRNLGLVFTILSFLAYAAIFVVIFMILTSLRRSLRNDGGFERSNIIRTRLIGIFLIGASLLYSLGSWVECRALARYMAESAYPLNTAFPFDFTQLIMGVLLFVVAEVFAIGYSLSEERKLTI